MSFSGLTPRKCDVVITPEEYQHLLERRAFQRLYLEHKRRQIARSPLLDDKPALRRLLNG